MDGIPKNLREIHSLGPATREWLVREGQVPAFERTQTFVAGYSDAGRGYAFVRHQPAFSQLLACVGGEGLALADGRWQRFPAGYAYLTAPRALCAYHVRPGRRWQVAWVLYHEARRLPGLEAGSPPRLVRADAIGLHLAIQGLCHEAASDAGSAALDLWAALVHRLAMQMLSPGGANPTLGHLWSAAHRDLGGEWDLKRMAGVAGMSQESLRRLCLQEVGRPPLAHLARLRMNLAADILGHTDEKIAAVAARVGYGDPFAFSTAFKRAMGEPPKRFRASHRVPTPAA